MANHLLQEQLLDAQQVTVTGCPRTDFYAEHLLEAVRDRSRELVPNAQQLILLNSNFSIGNPAYLSDEQQTRLLVQDLGHPPEEARLWQQREKKGLTQLAEIANRLAERFPAATVVFRPHPFERLETYHGLLDQRSNLHCLRTGTADAWLAHASVVIQRSCSTSIEAGMAGKVALSPTWVETSFERPAANRTSVACETPETLAQRVAEVLAGSFTMPEQVQTDYDSVIRDWFYQVDGRAHQRVAKAILKRLDTRPTTRSRRHAACRREVFGLNRGLLSRKRWQGQLRSFLRLPPTWSFSRRQDEPVHTDRFDAWRASAKFFDAEMVQQVVAMVDRGRGNTAVPVEVKAAADDEDQQFSYQQACAIKLTPGCPAQGGPLS